VKRKLIEVALPLEAINREAAREKSIRHGHPSTLHLWWARRPLAACRAVLFAQLVDDPSAHPDEFPTEEAQAAERRRLFRIIEDLVRWEASDDETVLEAARAEIRRSCGGDPPPVLDPFAGGGSIPLEAQRLGLVAHASDLNPVAVLICKALIEIPPRWAGHPPVHPRRGRLADAERATWRGAQGLAEDVRHYGAWMRDEAQRRIGHLYPDATLPDGSTAPVIAWIWARTVTCPNPACGATMPLVRSFWLGRKKGKEAWVRPVVEGKTVRFEIGHGPGGPPLEGTVTRSGATCLVCDSPVPFEHVRAEGRGGRMGAQLMAIVAEGDRRRIYVPPDPAHVEAAGVARPDDVPDGKLFDWPGRINVVRYGMTAFADLFTNRQLVALTTFSDLVSEAAAKVEADARAAGLTPTDAKTYATAIATYLALGVSRLSDLQNSLARWENTRTQVRNLFGRQAIPMVWDFAEPGLFSRAAGDFEISLTSIANVVCTLPVATTAHAMQVDATSAHHRACILCTDPPYYDNIGYADLSDFFYVWLRRSLRDRYPDLFSTLLTPKAEELVATPYRFGGSKQKAHEFFEDGFVRVFSNARAHHAPGFPLTLFYAFKDSDESDDGVGSAGWETMLEGLQRAGLAVNATWPMRTELTNKIGAFKQNMLASSIVLACRPRQETAGVTDRRGFIAALRAELPAELRLLQQGSIAPVDLAQAAIGPGMAVFSRYAKVVEPSGEPMRVRAALGLINQVLAEVLDEQEGDFDPDTRWAIKWFEQYGMDKGPSGDAIQLCTTYGTTLDGLERAGIAHARAGRTWLVPRQEMPADWDPAADPRVPVWEATQHLVKRLDDGGEQAAADLLRRLGGLADSAQHLAYRLYAICERKGWAKEAAPYNALGGSWSELQRLAARPAEAEQTRLGVDAEAGLT
jgi:putative DNA methylase